MTSELRPELGEFSSIVCFKAVITGMEEALGVKATAIALVSAGRSRGKKLAKDLGLIGTNYSIDLLALHSRLLKRVSAIFGADGGPAAST